MTAQTNGHNPAAVAVRRLTKTYAGGVEAVKGIDFDVAPGEVFGLLGPNGAGKSTTIGMLTTTIAPTSGSAALAGFDVVAQPLKARSVSSVVFQEPVVDRGLSGRANLELHAELWGVAVRDARRRIAELAVIAPALKAALGGLHAGIDYTAFVAVGTVGLLVPLATTFAGLSVIVDRDSGAQRELLAAPIPRTLLILGNLLVVLGLCALQIGVVIAAAALRGADFHISASGVAWFAAAAVLFVVLMYGIAETLASRIHQQEEYIGATPVIAIVPWFFAGALFPIGALPGALTAFAKLLPLTHAMALMRYGFTDPRGTGLHDIWGGGNTTAQAWLSLAGVALFAAAFVAIAIRSFTRSAVH